MPHARQFTVPAVAGLMVAGAFIAAAHRTPDPVVEIRQIAPVERSARVMPLRSASSDNGATAGPTTAGQEDPAACQGQSPGPSWSCHDGKWQVGPPPAPATVNGRIDREGGCLIEQTAPSLVCRDGLWQQPRQPEPLESPEPRESREPRESSEPPDSPEPLDPPEPLDSPEPSNPPEPGVSPEPSNP
jgi:hypothetical protein